MHYNSPFDLTKNIIDQQNLKKVQETIKYYESLINQKIYFRNERKEFKKYESKFFMPTNKEIFAKIVVVNALNELLRDEVTAGVVKVSKLKQKIGSVFNIEKSLMGIKRECCEHGVVI